MRWGLTGIVLVCLHLLLFSLSPRFAYGGDPLQRPILFYVAIQVICGVLFLLVAPRHPKDVLSSKGLLAWAIAVGIGLRMCMIASSPILEDDYYRYLWDGAVAANGVNPYSFAPSEVLEGERSAGEIPPVLFELARDSGVVVSRVNHPSLRTIYPPVAQAAFALAHIVHPWSLFSWRMVLFLIDMGTLALIILILRKLGLPLLFCLAYWWNPIVIKETFNSGHMDVLLLPFVLGAILLTIKKRHVSAVIPLALGIGVKVWPIALLPIVLRPLWGAPKRMLAALLLFGLLVGLMFIPVHLGGLQSDSGFVAYAQKWEMNDALFTVFMRGAKALSTVAGIFSGQEKLIARVVALSLLAVWIGWLAWYRAENDTRFCEKCLFAIAAIFLVSPAQYPWYYLWMVPLLAIRPRLSLLLWTALLPLYYLRFYFHVRGNVHIFDNGIVWLEHVPVWGLLIWEWYRAYRRRPNLTSPTEA